MGASLKLTAYEVANSVNVQSNTSRLFVKLEIITNRGTYNHSGDTLGSISVNGQAYSLNGKSVDYNTTTTLYEGTHTITHNTDGSKSVDVTAVFDPNTPGTSQMTKSQTVKLTAIARASTIGASDAYVGAVATVSVVRKSAAYTHSVAYSFGNLKGYLNADGSLSTSEIKLTETSIPFKIPDSFYTQISNAPSGDCTLTCKTYSGSTQIGDSQTAEFTVTARESACKPSVSGTVVDNNAATIALTGNSAKMVRYMSTALCTITAAAKNSASLSRKIIGGVAVEGDTLTIDAMEAESVVFTATDSRGYSISYKADVDLIPYVRLTAQVSAKRSDPTSGRAVLNIKGNFYNGSFGAQDNALTVTYQVGNGEQVFLTLAFDGDSYTASADLTGLDYQKSHRITVTVSDDLDTVSRSVTIGKGIPVFDWGESDFNFNVPVTVPAPAADAHAVNRGYVKDNAVLKTGGTMTGVLTVPTGFTVQSASYPSIVFVDTDDGVRKAAVIGDMSTRRMYMRSYAADTDYYENFLFPGANTGLTGNQQYNVLTTKTPVTVAQGGTGAKDAAAARSNLGLGGTRVYSGSLKTSSNPKHITFPLSSGNLFIIVGRTLDGYSLCSTVIPRAEITTTDIRWQFADNQYYVAFNLKYAGDTVTLTMNSASNASGEIVAVYGVF